LEDRELLARLRGSEAEAKDAFDELFRTWYARLVRAADAVVREPAVAEELVQDVMLELWRRRDRLAADGAVHAYLFQATRNRALNHVRHLQVERRGAVHTAADQLTAREPAAPAQLVAAEIDTAVQEAVASLTPRCREVFELSRVHGLRYAEIAETLGVSVKAVEAQMGKALKTLRERLSGWLVEDG
jgi:RNA polymerase sigma-70 factor (ECF subfamily)